MAVESCLLLLALLFVVALLRSHAEILRRLAGLEDRGARPPAAAIEASDQPDLAPAELIGQSPAGDALQLSLSPGSPRTLVAFLSSGCAACQRLWQELREGQVALPADLRLLAVTKGPDRESVSRLRALAPSGGTGVLMSNQAWEAFAVPATPHFALVADGHVLGRGSAISFDQILRLLADAEADRSALGPVRTSSERAARAEQALAAAGIGPGHPSLYPTRSVVEP